MGEYGAPSGGGYFKPASHKGNTILVTNVYEIEPYYNKFKNEDTDRARVDIHDLTEGETYEGAYLTNPGLVNSVRGWKPGKAPILATVGQVDTGKGNPAWTLINAAQSEEARKAADAFLDAYPEFAPVATGATGSDRAPF